MIYFWSFSFGVLILASAEKEKLDRNSITQPFRNYETVNVLVERILWEVLGAQLILEYK